MSTPKRALRALWPLFSQASGLKDMKAAGKSGEEIKKMVTEAKSKWEVKKTEELKNKQAAKSEKGTKSSDLVPWWGLSDFHRLPSWRTG